MHTGADQETNEAAQEENNLSNYTATYSPDDNKLRLYSVYRLDKETYTEAHDLGFRWAPKQGLFVAPGWTPEREDFLLKLCGDISDEDKTLSDRAEERAGRFENYSEKRAKESANAHDTVRSITDHIPLGQPILVGHHSERHARKDAERIENGMRKAVNLFAQSEYWTRRAAGALRNAKYKERADVRYRRIKNLEAEQRRAQKQIDDAAKYLQHWSAPELDHVRAVQLSGFDHVSKCFTLTEYPRSAPASQYQGAMSLYSAIKDGVVSFEQGREIAKDSHNTMIKQASRWIDHYVNRISYERAMLGESGGIAADKFEIVVGGMVLARGEWSTVVRVTRKDGKIISVTTNSRYVPKKGIEEVKDYRAPTEEQKQAATAASKLKPLVNFPSEGIGRITKAQWDKIPNDYKGTRTIEATAECGAHRQRFAMATFLDGVAKGQGHRYFAVYIADAKRKDPPAPDCEETAPTALPREPAMSATAKQGQKPDSAQRSEINQLKSQLAAGVKTVCADQLFETPIGLADRMIQESEPAEGLRWGEPSAGPGRLCLAILRAVKRAEIVAVEISPEVSQILSTSVPSAKVFNADFFDLTAGELGLFDRIVMNPPFGGAVDITHILRASTLLRPKGILVATCANGPRQKAELEEWCINSGGFFEALPEGTFKESGTNVNSALLLFRA